LACGRRRPGSAGPRITRVSSYHLKAPRWKHVGANARLADHGRAASDTVLCIETNAGVEGVGPSRATREAASRLIGRDPLEYWQADTGMASPLGHRDAPLWDLVGKMLQTPVWRLLGGGGTEWVPVYDSSFYFSDLDPAYAGRGIERILEELDHSMARGHRAFKLKIGRGFRWMEPEAGIRRDVEVARAARQHLGAGVRLMVDANNGFNTVDARRFLEQADDDFYWVEEMFRESVAEDLKFRAWLRDRGWKTLVADGESVVDASRYAKFIDAGALDVLQGNIHAFGLQRMVQLSRITAPVGIAIAPNNWGSFFGFYLELILGRAIPNFLMAEQDPGVAEVVDVRGFEFREGRCRVPDTPGCGWSVPRAGLEQAATLNWRVD